MSLLDLQKILNQQRNKTRGVVTINSATIQQAKLVADAGLDELIKGSLMLYGALQVTTTASIPIPDAKNGQLQFTGKAVFLEPFYPQELANSKIKTATPKPVTITFTLDANDANLVHLLVVFQPTNWTFQDSFQWLPDYPFKALIVSKQTLLFSSSVVSDYQWNTKAVSTLEKGLNYAAFLSNDSSKKGNPLSLITPIIKGASSSLVFTGIIDPSIITRPEQSKNLEVSNIILFPKINLSAKLGGAVELNWMSLKIDTPKIILETVDDNYGQSFWLSLNVGIEVNGKQQNVQAAMLKNFNQLCFGLSPEDRTDSLTINDIITLAGGNDFKQGLPDVLKSAFDKVGLRGANTSFYIPTDGSLPKPSSINFAIGATEDWELKGFTIKDKKVIIKDIVLQFFLFNPTSKPKPDAVAFSATMEFFPDVFKDSKDPSKPGRFTMALQHQVSSKITTINGKYEGEVSVHDILTKMPSTPLALPENFPEVTFSDFGVGFMKSSNAWGYQFYGTAKVGFELEILNGKLESSFSINVNKPAKSSAVFSLNGGLAMGNAYFSFTLNLSSEEKLMEASWYTIGKNLGLNSIAHALGFENFSIPEDLDLALVSASFSYDFKNKAFVLTADSENYGKVSISSVNISGSTKKALVFFCHLNGSLNAKALPLVGDEIGDYLEFSDLQFLLSTSDFNSISIPLPPTPKSNSTNPSITLANVKRGVTFLSTLKLGSDIQKIAVPIYHPTVKKENKLAQKESSITLPAQPANLGGSTAIGKSLGPFNFKKFGVSFEDKRLIFDLDASMLTAGMEIYLNGLGLGFSANDFTDVKGKLDGLAVNFQGGPVHISGGLIHNKNTTTGGESYDGQLQIKLNKLMISALGSYTNKEGEPSFFAFAIIDFPLGGPPFFFVTGGAIGFGYNRDLVIPGVNEVRNFPLIQAAYGQGGFEKGDLSNNLEKMLPAIPPKVGQNWLGLGVKFRSFNLIDGFALLTLNFGNQTEVNVLGLATAKIPAQAKKPIVYIEMALLAQFLPDRGVVSIEAALTNRAYVFSDKSKLTGGFAFYLWFKGDYAGDFVLTFGGYHPGYKIPSHYPIPQRVGIFWQITDQLSVSGQSYFALTPSCIMAGGALSCQWHSSSIRAWFLLTADFLIAWQPFHYDIKSAIDIGVSLSIKAWFVRKTITVSTGAAIHIWGPEFSGLAKIKLYFVSFSISFGSGSQQQPNPITWAEFKQACLPEKAPNSLLNKTVETTNKNICSIQVGQGLIKELSQKETSTDWVVSSSNFILEITTLIPIKTANFGSTDDLIKSEWKTYKINTDFGVGLVQVDSTQFTSDVTIEIIKEGEVTPLSFHQFEVNPILKNVPSSMWVSRTSPTMNDSLVKDTLAGFIIKPITPSPDTTLAIPLVNLLEVGISLKEIEFGTPNVPKTKDFNHKGTITTMMTTIDKTSVKESRSAILSLIKNDYSINTDINVAELKKEANKYWLSGPTMSSLGEEKW